MFGIGSTIRIHGEIEWSPVCGIFSPQEPQKWNWRIRRAYPAEWGRLGELFWALNIILGLEGIVPQNIFIS